jgi:hypothetical protein
VLDGERIARRSDRRHPTSRFDRNGDLSGSALRDSIAALVVALRQETSPSIYGEPGVICTPALI